MCFCKDSVKRFIKIWGIVVEISELWIIKKEMKRLILQFLENMMSFQSFEIQGIYFDEKYCKIIKILIKIKIGIRILCKLSIVVVRDINLSFD